MYSEKTREDREIERERERERKREAARGERRGGKEVIEAVVSPQSYRGAQLSSKLAEPVRQTALSSEPGGLSSLGQPASQPARRSQ